MHVTTRPIDAPAALFEETYTDPQGREQVTRVLVLKEGLVAAPVVTLLGKLLFHV